MRSALDRLFADTEKAISSLSTFLAQARQATRRKTGAVGGYRTPDAG